MNSDQLKTVGTEINGSLGKEISDPSKIVNPGANNTASSATSSVVKMDNTVASSDKELASKSTQPTSLISCDQKQDERAADTTTKEQDSSTNVFQQLKTGQLSFDKIPKLPKNVVRIFLSSTFTDTKEERNALMRNVYPRLGEYCREKHGLEFQVVDMRWGVPEQASNNHSTSDLCIYEIRKCQDVSVGPNFVAIIGDRYGYRPIPSSIPDHVFTALHAEVTSAGASDDVTSQWGVVEEWYRRDENALPPVHVLQPINSKIEHYSSGTEEERKIAAKTWNDVNTKLQTTLRKTAAGAHEKKTIGDEEMQAFFISVTESEVRTGVFDSRAPVTDTCYCLIRNITDVSAHSSQPKWRRFVDAADDMQADSEARELLTSLKQEKLVSRLPQSNLKQVNIEWSYSGASVSVESTHDPDVAKAAQSVTSPAAKHLHYLDDVCENFFVRIKQLIQRASVEQKRTSDQLRTEILQHWHLAKLRCDVFEGRDDVISQVHEYLQSSSNTPLLVHGKSGCGKTSIVAKVFEKIAQNEFDLPQRPLLVARFLGTTSFTSNLHQLLVTCAKQIADVLGADWTEPDDVKELIKSFHKLLRLASAERPIVLLLDSIDQLLPTYNAFKLRWLPEHLSPNVKVILSTIDDGFPILGFFNDRYASSNPVRIEVLPLGEKLGLHVIKRWLTKLNRTMTSQQEAIIAQALAQCSLPLYARIAFDYIVRWKSYDTPAVGDLDTSIKGAINRLFAGMEEKFGQVVVRHCLAYLSAARNGLSEKELEDVLSSDDLLLATVFKIWNPPIRRIPPLIWTRVRSDVNNYIVERDADGTLVLFWYHRQFIETTKARYLSSDESFSKHVSQHLADYFSGRWSNGREKPFTYTDAQVQRFSLTSPNGAADRKLPAQPYSLFSNSHGNETVWYNRRKMSELPFHLVKIRNYNQLKNEVFFNLEYLQSKLRGSSVQQLLEEFEVFMQSDKTLKKDIEMRLLYSNLQLMRPFLVRYPLSLAYELQGRLTKFINTHKNIASLVKQCDVTSVRSSPLVPLTSCFESADLGFSQNINFRSSAPWMEGGTFTVSDNFKTAYVIDYDEAGLPLLSVWDISSSEKTSQVQIKKVKDEKDKFTSDIYRNVYSIKNGKQLIAFCQVKNNASFQKEIKLNTGFADVIDVDTGQVLRSFEVYTFREVYACPLVYATDNYLCALVGRKMPVVSSTTGEPQNYTHISYLSKNEKYFVFTAKEKLSLREHDTREVIADFDVSEPQMSVVANDEFTIVAMVALNSRDITVFDLWSKKDNLKPRKQFTQLFKPKHVFRLDERMRGLVDSAFKVTLRDHDNKLLSNRNVSMEIARDNHHLLVTFVGAHWVSFLFGVNVYKYNARYIGEVARTMEVRNIFPCFTFDGSHVVYVTKASRIVVVESNSAAEVNSYAMQETVKALSPSKVDNRFAVMLQKSIVILNVTKTDVTGATGAGAPAAQKRRAVRNSPEVLLEREIVNEIICKEVVVYADGERAVLDEVDDLAEVADTDRLSSARSKRQYALEKHVTPDGNRTVHLHARLQVLDVINEQIKYTPKKGETVVRTTKQNGNVTNDVITIPGLNDVSTQRVATLDLKPGDRIVNENNKLKFRVEATQLNQFQIATVPSQLTVYTTEELKLRKLQTISVYNERVLLVSNSYIVTAKVSKSAHFVNVHSQQSGALLATHSTQQRCACAVFNRDESKLFVVDQSYAVLMLTAPKFVSVEGKFVLTPTETSSAFVVKELRHFFTSDGHDSLLVRFGPEGTTVLLQNRYILANMSTKTQSQEMQITSGSCDVTADGSLAADPMLNIYDLVRGTISHSVPYAAFKQKQFAESVVLTRRQRYEMAAKFQLVVRFAVGKQNIVVLDRLNSSLHLVRLDAKKSARFVASCSCHLSNVDDVIVRCGGRVVSLVSRVQSLHLAIVDPQLSAVTYSTDVIDETERALALRATLTQQVRQPEVDERSVYQRAQLLQDALGSNAQDGDEFVSRKQARRRNVAQSLPACLVLGEATLCSDTFKADLFSPNMNTDKMLCSNAMDALRIVEELKQNYDVIVLHLITNDVPGLNRLQIESNVCRVVNAARGKAELVVLSLAPCRADDKELNEKTLHINRRLEAFFRGTCTRDSHVHLCKNTNLNTDKKPNTKYLPDGLNLSLVGLKRLVLNLKEVIGKHIKTHVI